ncbi:TolC family protein [Gemmata sp. G18]|uniref:TolC family protein n=1 Tax=Gemmata palustris TaxID=2822762 RepID=A0ABS5BMJ1_9BACT|nr:TolC family protein [Gemmata palustris]MBP3954885.1 TolC family protein [Gemmata palustris]
MTYWAISVRRLLLAGVTAGAATGCGGPEHYRSSLDHRVLPPSVATRQPPTRSPDGAVKQVRADLPVTDPVSPSPGEPAPPVTDGRTAAGPLSLPDAVALAHRLQPRLQVFLEGVVQAKGAETVAVAPFLPTAVAGYSVGGFDLNAGGAPVPFGAGTPNFTFLPFTGAVPVGLNLNTGYELAELRVQWLLADFGRRMGRYWQAELGVDIARLQTDRAYQTVANDVALAYYQVLRARSLRRIAEEAVRRAEEDLDVAKKLEKGGVIEKEKVLRAEVLLSQAQRGRDAAEAGAGISVAALNLAIGLNISAATQVLTPVDLPELDLSLADCLGQAVSRRRELEVAQLSIQSAQLGGKVARAEFRPKVAAGGSLLDFQQSAPRGHTDLAVGFIKLEWNLFEGGRRVGEVRISDSKLRAAAAQAEALADTIAFQVNESYRQLTVARRGIDRSKPAVEQAREAYRLLRARAARGDATAAEVTEAETALTHAEQDYLNATYDYLIALARLNFAIGRSSVPPDAAPPGRP